AARAPPRTARSIGQRSSTRSRYLRSSAWFRAEADSTMRLCPHARGHVNSEIAFSVGTTSVAGEVGDHPADDLEPAGVLGAVEEEGERQHVMFPISAVAGQVADVI